MENVNEHFCIPMTDGSFRIHTMTSAPYTNGSTTINVAADATPAELTKAIMKVVNRHAKEFARYLVQREKEKVRKETIRREILSYRSTNRYAVACGMDESSRDHLPRNGDYEGAILAEAEERYFGE